MTRLPWDPAELGRDDLDLDEVAQRLMRHASEADGAPRAALTGRIAAAVEDEPLPAAPWWQRMRGGGGFRATVGLMATAAVLVAAIVGGLNLRSLVDSTQNPGSEPTQAAPVVTPSVSASPTASPSPSPTATATSTPSPSPSPVSSARLMTPVPTIRIETPEPDESDEPDEPEDPDDDNSGPGGGGGDNSGPGGGNSGRGGGDDGD